MNYQSKPSSFSWNNLGDIQEGRGNLGTDMPVQVYRLFQFTMKDILSREYDRETACNILRAAGHLAGKHFTQNVLDINMDFHSFIALLEQSLKNLKIGILQMEHSDLDALHFILSISEDLDCSGLPVTDETVCDYDEGCIAGIMEEYTGKAFTVKEVDCWATGGRTCRFEAKVG